MARDTRLVHHDEDLWAPAIQYSELIKRDSLPVNRPRSSWRSVITTRQFLGSERRKGLRHYRSESHERSCPRTFRRLWTERKILLTRSTRASMSILGSASCYADLSQSWRLHRWQYPLCRLCRSSTNNPSERPPLRCLHVRYWRVFQTRCTSIPGQGRIWYILGISDWRCEPRGLQSISSEPEVTPSKLGNGRTSHWREIELDARCGVCYEQKYTHPSARRLSSGNGAKSTVSGPGEYGSPSLYNTQHCAVLRQSHEAS